MKVHQNDQTPLTRSFSGNAKKSKMRYEKERDGVRIKQGNFFAPQDVKNKYRYNGKEFIEDFDIGLYDYGARWYDPAVGRFMGVDPIAEKYAYVTTFNYAENEPVAHIDLWGLQKVDMIWNDPNLKGATKEQYEKFRYESTKDAVELLETVVLLVAGEAAAGAAIEAFSKTEVGRAVFKGVSKWGDDIVEGSKGLIKRALGKGEETIETGAKSVDDIIEGTTKGKTTKGRTKNFEKDGNFDVANKDFDELKPNNIKEIENGRVGDLKDGKKVVVRNNSSDGRPTLEIQKGKNKTKIRYNEK